MVHNGASFFRRAREGGHGMVHNGASLLKDGLRKARRNWQLYLLVFLPVVFIIIFKYVPLWGAQIAFRDYKRHTSFILSVHFLMQMDIILPFMTG